MNEMAGDYQEFSLTAEQIKTLACIKQSFDFGSLRLRRIAGWMSDHDDLLTVKTMVEGGGKGGGYVGEWIIRGDGEVISRAGAAAEPEEWLKEGQEPV